MRRVNRPSFEVGPVYRLCISKVGDVNLKMRFENCEALVITASREFEEKGKQGNFHQLESDTTISGLVTSNEMVSIYTNRMAKKGSPGRSIYDALMMLPQNGKCPFCGHRMVATLDHYMPKASFPILSVVPLNLVASCRDCNFEKRDLVPASKTNAPLHPYFDIIDDVTWLTARVLETRPSTIEFSVSRPTSWSEDLYERVRNHFDCLHLQTLYSSNAAEELSNIEYNLQTFYNSSGRQGVQSFLEDAAESRMRADRNSWQSALYSALAVSDWYCDGGFSFEDY